MFPFAFSGRNNGILALVVRLGDCSQLDGAYESLYGTVFLIGNKFLHWY